MAVSPYELEFTQAELSELSELEIEVDAFLRENFKPTPNPRSDWCDHFPPWSWSGKEFTPTKEHQAWTVERLQREFIRRYTKKGWALSAGINAIYFKPEWMNE